MRNYLLAVMLLVGNQAFSQCASAVSITQQSCIGNCSGLVVFTANGGQLPYSLYIDSIGPITLTTQTNWGNLCPGVHNYTVIDVNGDTCTGSGNFTINITNPPDATVLVSNASCSGCNDGSATVYVTGGTPPYIYIWNNGATTPSVTGLPTGFYDLTVVDANGCTDYDTVYVGVGGGLNNTISGQVFFDTNTNGFKDLGEPGVGNQIVEMANPAFSAYTNSNGDYAFVVNPGTYDISYATSPGWNLTSSPATYNIPLSGPSVFNIDFGIYPDSTYASGYACLTSGWPRCNDTVPYYLSFLNNGFTVLDGTLQFNHDALQLYISSSITPSSQSGTQLNYNFTGLAPGTAFLVTVNLIEPGPATFVTTNLNVLATDVFSNEVTDSVTLAQTIFCSYDPNDKAVYPEGYGPQHFVEMDTDLDYLIRFQNTGNDTAFSVVIIDTLDAGLDLSTFTVTGSSHNLQTVIGAGGIIEFRFDYIQLPDSNVNEPMSHGFVQYRIKGLATNPDPTVINNTAYIYFDQNPPVQTNTALTTYSDVFLGITEPAYNDGFQLYPNPFGNYTTLMNTSNVKGNFNVTMYDISGRKVMQLLMDAGKPLEISRGSLQAGQYIIKIEPVSGGPASYVRLSAN